MEKVDSDELKLSNVLKNLEVLPQGDFTISIHQAGIYNHNYFSIVYPNGGTQELHPYTFGGNEEALYPNVLRLFLDGQDKIGIAEYSPDPNTPPKQSQILFHGLADQAIPMIMTMYNTSHAINQSDQDFKPIGSIFSHAQNCRSAVYTILASLNFEKDQVDFDLGVGEDFLLLDPAQIVQIQSDIHNLQFSSAEEAAAFLSSFYDGSFYDGNLLSQMGVEAQFSDALSNISSEEILLQYAATVAGKIHHDSEIFSENNLKEYSALNDPAFSGLVELMISIANERDGSEAPVQDWLEVRQDLLGTLNERGELTAMVQNLQPYGLPMYPDGKIPAEMGTNIFQTLSKKPSVTIEDDQSLVLESTRSFVQTPPDTKM